MRKQIQLAAIFLIAVLISFICGQSVCPVEACVNTFDADGNLCIIGTPELPGTTTQEIGTPMELWAGVGNAGAGTLVGHITFDNESVIIHLSDADNDGIPDMYPWVATAVHIHFADDINNFPLTQMGNPIPGHFEYNVDDLNSFAYIVEVFPFETVIRIPVEFDAVGAIHIAVEHYGGAEALEYYLPTNAVQMEVVDFPSLGDPSYLKITLDEAGSLNGLYESWCGDLDAFIAFANYTAQLYSSYDDNATLLARLFEQPENLDKVNYLLNTFSAGDVVQPLDENCAPKSSCGSVLPPEALTYGDIQVAIWTLLEDRLPNFRGGYEANINPWSESRVNAILCDVDANGENFVPVCGQKVAFLVVPDDGSELQISLVDVPCETADETAWGDGKHGANFLDSRQWATYFFYDAGCVPEE